MVNFLNFFRRKNPQREASQKFGSEHWQTQYNIFKSELAMRVMDFTQKRRIENANHVLVGYVMTAEPGNPDVWSAANSQETQMAKQVAAQALEDPEMRKLAAEASYALALLFQGQAYNPRAPSEPDWDKLNKSLICLQNALKYGDRPAFYNATAAQTLGMMKDFEGAYEHAKAAVAADPANPEALRMAGMTALALDRPDESEQYLLQAQSAAPELAGVKEGLTQVNRMRGVLQAFEAEAALSPNLDEGTRKLIRDAHDGNPNAMGILAYAYSEGQGMVTANAARAYMWYYILARLGDQDCKEILRIARKLDAGAREGRQLADQWLRARGL